MMILKPGGLYRIKRNSYAYFYSADHELCFVCDHNDVVMYIDTVPFGPKYNNIYHAWFLTRRGCVYKINFSQDREWLRDDLQEIK